MRLGAAARRPANREAAIQFGRALGAKIAGLPGIKAQGGVSTLPLTSSVGWGSINVEGFVRQPGQELQVDQRAATADYFRAMEIPLVRGRFFTEHDTMPNAQPVVLVDENFARRFWPREDTIGKKVWRDPKNKMSIVGVVGSVKQYGLDVEGRIVVYYPGILGGYWVARTSSEPAAAAGAIVAAIHELDPTIPVYETRTMTGRLSDSLARRRFSMIMLGTFSGFALILAAVGIYGVMSYLVTQGTHDIGVRMALGAEAGSIARMVVGQGLKLAIAGVAAGLIGAAALTRVMASLLFGVTTTDVVTFSTVPMLLGGIAVLATYITARRATRVDPLVALREE
jgi:predicted permease